MFNLQLFEELNIVSSFVISLFFQLSYICLFLHPIVIANWNNIDKIINNFAINQNVS